MKRLLPKHWIPAGLAMAVWAWTVSALAAQTAPAEKVSPPAKSAQEKAAALIEKLFRDDLQKSKDDPAAGKALAATLLQEGKATADDPVLRFVALSMARDLAIDAGDLNTGLSAIDELTRYYKVDGLTIKIEALTTAAGKKNPSRQANQAVADLALELLGEAIAADNFAAAKRLVEAADLAAQNLKSISLLGTVEKRRHEVAVAEKEFTRIKTFVETLQKTPDDPEANRELGRYYCLVKGNWQRGLPLLAKGDDNKLKELAERDLAKPATSKSQVDLGDSWYEYAGTLKGKPGSQALVRAYHWYAVALPRLEGLTRLRVQSRVDELSKLVPAAAGVAHITTEIRRVAMVFGDAARHIAFSPDARQVLSSSFGGKLYLYDVATGNNLRLFDVNKGRFIDKTKDFEFSIQGMGFSPDGKLAAAAHTGKTVHIWDAKTGDVVQTLTGHTNWVRAVHFLDGQRLLTAGDDSTLRLWNYHTGKEMKMFPVRHLGFINTMSVNKSGTRAATGGDDKTTRIWDLAQADEIRRLDHFTSVYGVALAPDGKRVASIVTSDTFVRVHDVDSGKELYKLDHKGGYVNAVLFSPDGRHIFTGSAARLPVFGDLNQVVKGDNSIRVWDAANGHLVRSLTGHTKGLTSLAISADGRFLVSGSSDFTIRIWGEKSGTPIEVRPDKK